jgi:malate synthase
MPDANQISCIKPNGHIAAADLLQIPAGDITEAGLRWNVDVGLQYLQAWLNGNGCVPIYNLMEDAATAEICRSQVWQWVKHEARLDDGRTVTPELVADVVSEQKSRLGGERLELAADLFRRMMISPEFPEFLTLVAYEYLDQTDAGTAQATT